MAIFKYLKGTDSDKGVVQFYCLQKDLTSVQAMNDISTGSVCDVIDTGDTFIYEGETKTWYQKTSNINITSNNITDATTVGKALLTSPTKEVVIDNMTDNAIMVKVLKNIALTEQEKATARTVMGSGTSSLALGTTSTTAKKGDYAPAWADVTGKPSTFTPPNANTTTVGGVKQCPTQANSTATDVATLLADFNSLLAKLKAAGIML